MRRPDGRGSINSNGMNSDESSDDEHGHGHGHGHAPRRSSGEERRTASVGGASQGHGHSHSSGGHGHGHGGQEDERSHSHGAAPPIVNYVEEDTPLLESPPPGVRGRQRNPEHAKEARAARNKLLLASVLCAIFMVGEVVGGFMAHSLAIMTDAAHMLSDLAGFMISLFAIWLSQRPSTKTMSFGFHRAEIIGAIASVLLIWALTGVLVYEAVLRVIDQPDVDGKIMCITAACGVAVNILMGLTLHQPHGHGGHGHSHGDAEAPATNGDSHGHGKGENINVRAAFVHVIGDLVQSIGVLIAAIIIWVHPEWKIADPICTFVFSILVLFTTIGILRDSIHVLMEGVPKGIEFPRVKLALETIPGVRRVHDMHIWSLTMGKPAIAVHIETLPSVDGHAILVAAQDLLCDEYGIHHTTIQIETEGEGDFAHCIGGANCNNICSDVTD